MKCECVLCKVRKKLLKAYKIMSEIEDSVPFVDEKLDSIVNDVEILTDLISHQNEEQNETQKT